MKKNVTRIIFNKIYSAVIIFLYLNNYNLAFAADASPFDNDPGVQSALPVVIKILQFIGVLLVKWVCPLLGAYLIAKGCWVGATAQGAEKESWKSKVIFGGCLIAIRVFINMFTTWLN